MQTDFEDIQWIADDDAYCTGDVAGPEVGGHCVTEMVRDSVLIRSEFVRSRLGHARKEQACGVAGLWVALGPKHPFGPVPCFLSFNNLCLLNYLIIGKELKLQLREIDQKMLG